MFNVPGTINPLESAMLLLFNVDDLSGEAIPHVIDGLMAQGAMAVHVVPTWTKKNRAGFLFFVDASAEQLDKLGGFLVAETGTLGLRIFEPRHIHFDYQVATVDIRLTHSDRTADAPMRVRVKKVLNREKQVVFVKAEHTDLQAVLHQLAKDGIRISLTSLKRSVEQAVIADEVPMIQNIRVECIDIQNEAS